MPFPKKTIDMNETDTNASGGGAISRFENGVWYSALMVDFEERENDKGPYVLLTFMVFNDEGYTMTVRDFCSPNMDWKLRKWFGLVADFEGCDTVEVDFNRLMNRHCKVTLKDNYKESKFKEIDKYQKTGPDNMPNDHVLREQTSRKGHANASVTTQPRPKVTDDEEIPF
jgi:hypothetical protein